MKTYDWHLIEREDGWEVSQDRKVWIDQLTQAEATDYVERRRNPSDSVVVRHLDGETHDITRSLRRVRQRA